MDKTPRVLAVALVALIVAAVLLESRGSRKDTPAARRASAEYDLVNILRVAELFRMENSRYPTAMGEMIDATDDGGKPLAVSLAEYPTDPWQHPYVYELVAGSPRVTSLGSDGVAGGQGEAEDVSKNASELPQRSPESEE